MGSIVSKIADEIALHGSWEAYLKFQWDKQLENGRGSETWPQENRPNVPTNTAIRKVEIL